MEDYTNQSDLSHVYLVLCVSGGSDWTTPDYGSHKKLCMTRRRVKAYCVRISDHVVRRLQAI